MNLQCPICNNTINTEDIASITCDRCLSSMNIHIETHTVSNEYKAILDQQSQVLEKGDLVKVCNQEHAWYNEIALICDLKPLFYRLEIRGKTIWVPTWWVKKHECDESYS